MKPASSRSASSVRAQNTRCSHSCHEGRGSRGYNYDMAIPLKERFMRHVRKTPTCWLWTGTTAGTTARYGYFRTGTRSTDPKRPAHRVSYEIFVGTIPGGMEIDHVAERGCTSKLCVNPAHLEPVTHAENRKRSRLKVCRAGLHDLTQPESSNWDSKGNRRGCKECSRTRSREYARAKALQERGA